MMYPNLKREGVENLKVRLEWVLDIEFEAFDIPDQQKLLVLADRLTQYVYGDL